MAKKKKSFWRRLRKGFKRSSKFQKFMTFYIIIAAVALIIFFIVFSNFIASYEASQPVHGVEELAKVYEEGNVEKLVDTYITGSNKFESPEALVTAYSEMVKDKEISYQEDSEYREGAPVYKMLADGLPVAKVYVVKGDKGAFGMDRWVVSDVDIYSYLHTSKTITISAPSDATIFVNGIEVDDSYITSSGEVPSMLANVTSFLSSVPTNTTYTIPGFFETPTVTAKSASGAEMSVAASENAYTVGTVASQSFIDEMDPKVKELMEMYGKKYINVGGSMADVVIPGSPFEEGLELSTTYWYPSEYIANYNFENEQVSNYVIYSDECFSCDIDFDLIVNFTSAAYETQNEGAHMIWLFIKSGDTYKLADSAYK